MKKIFTLSLLCLVSLAMFSQKAQYGKMTYEPQNGFYFEDVTDNMGDTLFIGKTVQEALVRIDELIGICHIEGSSVQMVYRDSKEQSFYLLKREIPNENSYNNQTISIIYARKYGVPGQCTWDITKAELYGLMKSLINWNK